MVYVCFNFQLRFLIDHRLRELLRLGLPTIIREIGVICGLHLSRLRGRADAL